jgi:hypothetical protein
VRRCVITAFAELQRLGRFDRECLHLVMSIMAGEVHRFPALIPAGGWQLTDVEDCTQEFLVERHRAMTDMLLATAYDDDSMGRLLRRSIRNWLVDQARETAVGHVRQALERLLNSVPEFAKVPPGRPGAGRWYVADDVAPGPWSGDLNELVQAARTVRKVRIPPWSSTSRRAPIADRASLIAVARAVLERAAGSVDIAELTHVFVRRFPVALDPAVQPADVEVESFATGAPTPEEHVVEESQELEAASQAVAVAGMLSPQERTLLACRADITAIQTALGCGRSKAYQQAKRLNEKLVQLAGDDEEGRAVIREVIRLCAPATE